MNMTLWRPFESLWRDNRDNLFDNFFEPSSNLVPSTDISEDENEYEVKMDLPGIQEKDISITLKDGILEIKGKKQKMDENRGKMYCMSEISYGSFSRSFSISNFVDSNKIKAKYKNGVLSINIPKTEESKPKKVEILLE